MWDTMKDNASAPPAPTALKPRGQHPDKRLKTISVRTKPPGRYADGNGLYLFVEPSGSRRWVLRTVVARKRRDIGLGSAQLVSLVDAREEARRLRKIAREGGDPVAERRRERRMVLTFKEAAQKVHAAHAETFRSAKHKAQWLSSLDANVFPVFGDRPVNVIDVADVLKALSPIWTTKPETARRLKQRIKVVFDWAKASGFRSGDNPVDGLARVLPKHRGEKQHHAALAYQAVPAFLVDLDTAGASETIRLAFELLILTAARTNEILRATWAEVDLDAKTWTIPGARMKSGREHRVPLSPRAVEILTRAQAIAGDSAFVFPGRSATKPLSNMAFLMLLRRMQHETITTHGFRSSFRDWAAEKRIAQHDVCEAALAHALTDKTEAAYNRTDLFELRRSLMDAWATFATAKPGKVVAMRA